MASVSQEGVGENVRYAPLADTRLVAAGFVFHPYAAEPIAGRECQGCAARTTGAERKEPGLDAGEPGDYLASPSKDGKLQRPEAGQGSGPRACPPRTPPRPWEAFHSGPIRSTQPGSQRPIEPHSAAAWQGFGGAQPWGVLTFAKKTREGGRRTLILH